jgi:protein-S-isoprenylcysteine O-methyltransferase Ste14
MPEANSIAYVVGQIEIVSNCLGLFLALVSIFTSEQSRRLNHEGLREGGVSRSQVNSIVFITTGLLLATLAGIIVMIPLFLTCLSFLWSNAVCSFFVLVFILLIGLIFWQIAMIIGSFRFLRSAS